MSSRIRKYFWKELRYPFGHLSTSLMFDFLIRAAQNDRFDDPPMLHINTGHEDGSALQKYLADSAARDINAKTLRLSIQIKQ